MTTYTREAVQQAVEAAFPAEDPAVVMDILDAYGVESYERERERVQLAIIQLSQGDSDRLLHYVQAAKTDYRDVLWWADSPPADS